MEKERRNSKFFIQRGLFLWIYGTELTHVGLGSLKLAVGIGFACLCFSTSKKPKISHLRKVTPQLAAGWSENAAWVHFKFSVLLAFHGFTCSRDSRAEALLHVWNKRDSCAKFTSRIFLSENVNHFGAAEIRLPHNLHDICAEFLTQGGDGGFGLVFNKQGTGRFYLVDVYSIQDFLTSRVCFLSCSLLYFRHVSVYARNA